jgi:hypothetical protein
LKVRLAGQKINNGLPKDGGPTVKEAVGFVTVERKSPRNVPEVLNFQRNRCEKLKPRKPQRYPRMNMSGYRPQLLPGKSHIIVK